MSNIEEDVAQLWETFETGIMKRNEFYLRLLGYLTEKYNLNKKSKIMCAATGHGTLYSILLEEDYNVYGNDGSQEMISRLNQRVLKSGLKHLHEVTNYFWQELAEHYTKEFFDFIFTEGNSLIYAGSWAKEKPNLAKARDEIGNAISNKARILKSGGIWYVDIPKEEEIETSLRVRLEINKRKGEFYHRLHNDWKKRVRHFTMEMITDKTKKVKLIAPLITGAELEEMATKYFSKIVKLDHLNDPHYQAYILKK